MNNKTFIIPEGLALDRDLEARAKGYFLMFLPYCNANWSCDLGMRGLAEAMSIRENTIRSYIRKLSAMGWCEIWREKVTSTRGKPRVMFRLLREKHEHETPKHRGRPHGK